MKKSTCVIYLRTSNEEDSSYDSQQKTCETYAHEHKMSIMAVFKDVTSSLTIKQSLVFNEMLQFVEDHKIDYVVVAHADRLAHKLIDAIFIDELVASKGASIEAVKHFKRSAKERYIVHSLLADYYATQFHDNNEVSI